MLSYIRLDIYIYSLLKLQSMRFILKSAYSIMHVVWVKSVLLTAIKNTLRERADGGGGRQRCSEMNTLENAMWTARVWIYCFRVQSRSPGSQPCFPLTRPEAPCRVRSLRHMARARTVQRSCLFEKLHPHMTGAQTRKKCLARMECHSG